MRQIWIYFCYRFYASLVNSLKLSTPHVSCHSYFSGDFKVNSHSLFADDFWSVVTQFSLLISFVNRELVCVVDSIHQPWLNFQRWFLVLLWLIVCWRFHASNMNLFLLSVLYVAREYVDAVDSISQLSLIFHWRFQGLLWLCFRWRFLVGSNAVFTDDSMRQRWLCFL